MNMHGNINYIKDALSYTELAMLSRFTAVSLEAKKSSMCGCLQAYIRV